MDRKTSYFAFGSNLLASRMHINNPTAVRVGVGKLEDYALDFASYSRIWHGYAATIVPKPESHVWGALWEIPNEDIYKLDRQEGVQANLYYPIEVEVKTLDGKTLISRCYRQPEKVEQVSLHNLPDFRKPSPAYLDTMIKGALESGLPTEYIEYLKTIPHNGSDLQPDLSYIYPPSSS